MIMDDAIFDGYHFLIQFFFGLFGSVLILLRFMVIQELMAYHVILIIWIPILCVLSIHP